jgi:hypothetical protein
MLSVAMAPPPDKTSPIGAFEREVESERPPTVVRL